MKTDELFDEFEDSLYERNEAKRRRKMRRDRDKHPEGHEKRISEMKPISKRAGRLVDDYDDDEIVADADLSEDDEEDDEYDWLDDEDEYGI